MEDDDFFNKEDFGARVRALTDRFESVADAARFLGVKEQTLRNAREGKNEPRAPLLLALSRRLGVSMDYLLGLSPPSTVARVALPDHDTKAVPKLDIRAAAGAGAVNHSGGGATLTFPLWMLRKLSKNIGNLRLLRAVGDSMSPTIEHGALLLVDEAENKLPDKTPHPKRDCDQLDIYVFSQGDELRVKRLRKTARGDLIIFCDNRAYDPESLGPRDRQGFKIHGRVVWWDNRL